MNEAPVIKLLPITVNQSWKAMLVDLVNTLDDMLLTFDGRRRVSDADIDNTISRWKDGMLYSVFSATDKQHIGVCGWFSMNLRESAVQGFSGICLTNNRPDEKEIKRQAYGRLVNTVFGNVQHAKWVTVKTRSESKDAPILKDIGFSVAAEFKDYLFVDGKHVSVRISAVSR